MAIDLITSAQRYLKTRVAGVNGLPVVAGDVNPIITAVNDILDGTTTLTEVEVGNGTAAAPSMSFTSDTDTGIYHPVTANQVAITAAGTGQVIFTDGTVEPLITNDIDLGTSSKLFKNEFVINLDAGASGTAGTVDVFPTTAARGKIAISAADSAGDTTTTITNASQAGARTYTIPDAGTSASFAMTEGNQTINGSKTFSSRIVSAGATASGTVATEGYLYTGTLVNTAGATPRTLDVLVGTALFNTIADTAAGTDVAATQVINNSFVTANTRAIVSVFSQTVAANSCFVVKNATMGSGTITVTLHNAGSATSGATGACGISFTLYQV